jgi:hypothetical protein
MEKNAQDVTDWWLKTVAVQGLGLVLIAVLSLIFLWFVWKMSSLIIGWTQELKHWVPTWFKADIETRRKFAEALDIQTETMGQIGSSCVRTEDGTKHLVKAFACHVSRNPNIGSDVVIHLTNAEEVLLPANEQVMKKRKPDAPPGFGQVPVSDH